MRKVRNEYERPTHVRVTFLDGYEAVLPTRGMTCSIRDGKYAVNNSPVSEAEFDRVAGLLLDELAPEPEAGRADDAARCEAGPEDDDARCEAGPEDDDEERGKRDKAVAQLAVHCWVRLEDNRSGNVPDDLLRRSVLPLDEATAVRDYVVALWLD